MPHRYSLGSHHSSTRHQQEEFYCKHLHEAFYKWCMGSRGCIPSFLADQRNDTTEYVFENYPVIGIVPQASFRTIFQRSSVKINIVALSDDWFMSVPCVSFLLLSHVLPTSPSVHTGITSYTHIFRVCSWGNPA